MKKDQKGEKAIISLLGAVGFIILIVGIFSDIYEFWEGVLLALIVWVITAAISFLLGVDIKKPSPHRALIIILGGAGGIAILAGIVLSVYEFWVGLIIGFGLWAITGALKVLWGVDKEIAKEQKKKARNTLLKNPAIRREIKRQVKKAKSKKKAKKKVKKKAKKKKAKKKAKK
ncbi:hypothetical protein ACFL1H_07260 [Nanoarchaeota archaeon]